MRKVLILSDNPRLVKEFDSLIKSLRLTNHVFDFTCTKGSEINIERVLDRPIRSIQVKNEVDSLIKTYDLIFSLHCKQLFPAELVNAVRCINVHPGLNPYNRGWFPQVFSILNGLPVGATIHEIDEELDHGKIIAQKNVSINSWDTSLDVYDRVLEAETELLRDHLISILENNYHTTAPAEEGNVNLKKDFNALLKLDLNKHQSIEDTLNLLRALTHGSYRNAFYIDPDTGKKVFVNITLEPEDERATD